MVNRKTMITTMVSERNTIGKSSTTQTRNRTTGSIMVLLRTWESTMLTTIMIYNRTTLVAVQVSIWAAATAMLTTIMFHNSKTLILVEIPASTWEAGVALR